MDSFFCFYEEEEEQTEGRDRKRRRRRRQGRKQTAVLSTPGLRPVMLRSSLSSWPGWSGLPGSLRGGALPSCHLRSRELPPRRGLGPLLLPSQRFRPLELRRHRVVVRLARGRRLFGRGGAEGANLCLCSFEIEA